MKKTDKIVTAKPSEINAEVQKTTPVVVKKQVELSDFDFEILNTGQYSAVAWEAVGRRHKADPDTREAIEGSKGRGYLMVAKTWPALQPPQGVPLSTKNVNNVLNEVAPIQGKDNSEGILAVLKDGARIVSDETGEEQV